MKILLSYSKFHFDPKSDDENKFKNSSAAINARTLYNVLCSFGDVEYIDFSEWQKVKGKKYDLFVGINHNFDNILKHCEIKNSVYYAVNQYPTERNKILRKFNKDKQFINFTHNFRLFWLQMWKKSWRNSYKKEFAPMVKSILSADAIICLGNKIVKNSYIKHGYPKEKFFLINYDLQKGKAIDKSNFHKQIKILYIATELCLRKGTDIIYDIFMNLSHRNLEYKLTVVGGSGDSNNQYLYLINELVRTSNGKVVYLGPLFGKPYEDVLQNNDFYIFPSIEEGQAGTVLDAMYNGLVPIITRESGVDFSPLGFLEPKLCSAKNYAILESVFDLSDEKKKELSHQTVDYYNYNHLGFEKKLRDILGGIINSKNTPE